jgi:hypothetical protein
MDEKQGNFCTVPCLQLTWYFELYYKVKYKTLKL